jgi:hypothetical protein
LFRLQSAEQAIHTKTESYRINSKKAIQKLETTYDEMIKHSLEKTSPRLYELGHKHKKCIGKCRAGLERVRAASAENRAARKTTKHRTNNLVKAIEAQIEDLAGEEVLEGV